MKKALFSLVAFLFSANVFSQELVGAPLSLFPVEISPGVRLASGGNQLKIKILTANTKALLASIPKGVRSEASKDEIELTLEKTYFPVNKNRPGKELLESSFLIDHQEPVVVTLTDEFKTRLKSQSLLDVEKFVNRYIEKKNSSDILPASVVAIRKEGDCKGHAILTSAFMRRLKSPSRVVLGIVFTQLGERLQAAGHAWSEVYQDGKWIHADAAQVIYKSSSFYLPLSQIKDESASFQMGLGQNALPAFEKIMVESLL